MVFQSISSELATDNQPVNNGLKLKTNRIPPVLDRLLAFIFDLLILTPVVGFFLFWILKDIKNFTSLDRDLFEIQVLWLLYTISFAFISTLILGVFIYKYTGSPGQIFMKLKVVNYPDSSQTLTFEQSLARSFFYFLNFAFLGLPFLELFTNQRRRIMHERISETMVVSLTQGQDDFPLPIEKKFFSLFSKYLLVGVLVAFLFGFYIIYTTVTKGGFRESDPFAKEDTCSMNLKLEGYSSLDVALVYHLMGLESRDCLDYHVEKILWKGSGLEGEENSSQIIFAYLAAGLSELDLSRQEKYLSLVCQKKEKLPELCSVAEYFQKKEISTHFGEKSLKYLVSDYFMLESLMNQNKSIKSIQQIHKFYNKGISSDYLRSKELKIIWALNKEVQEFYKHENPLKLKGSEQRKPASVDTFVQIEEKKKILLEYVKEKGLE